MDFQSGAVRPVDSLSDGWSIIKDNYWMYVLMLLLTFVILFAVAMVLGLINQAITIAIAAGIGAATGSTTSGGAAAAASFLPAVISMIISIFTNIIVLTVSGAMFCGVYTAMARTATTGTVEFGDLFAGFSKISSCLIVAVIISVVQFAIGILQLAGFMAVGVGAVGFDSILKGGEPNPAMLGGMVGGMLLIFAISLVVQLVFYSLTSFIYPLIAERDLSGGQAFTLSVRAGLANIGGLILLMLLMGVLVIVAAIPCLLGLPFIAPILSAGMYAAYLSVFGRNERTQNYNPPPPPDFGRQPGF